MGALTLCAVLLSFGGLNGCAASRAGAASVPPAGPAAASGPSDPGPIAPAPVGRPARSTRISFIPATVVLPGGASAPVEPARTVGGRLRVPENVRHVGWWDGSAAAGDPYGHTVIAGHVDSATDGLGFFARLLTIHKDDTLTVRNGSHHLAYRVTSVQTVKQDALATRSHAFDQAGPARLVLITCGGNFHRDQGGYDSNVVITAKPLGLAR